MLINKIKAFAPATIANISCGFDVLGLALENLGDEVIVKLSDKPGVVITKIEGDNGKLPLEAEKNTCTVCIIELLKKINSKQGLEIELYKKLPLGSGMGSSSASAVAGIVAANAILGNPFNKIDLLPFVMESERVACGSAHADNVAPSLLGGIVLIKSYQPLDVIALPTNLDIYCSIVHPNLQVNTKDSRAVLPKNIPLQLASKQWGYIAGLVAGFLKNDIDLVSRSLNDFIIEPSRAHLIPHFYEVKEAALKNKALGCSISGSGPTIFALSNSKINATIISNEMSNVFNNYGITNQQYISKINFEGAKII